MASRLPEQRRSGTRPNQQLGIPSGTRLTTVGRCSPSHAQGYTPARPQRTRCQDKGFPCRSTATTDSSPSCSTGPLDAPATREIADTAATDPRRARAQTPAADQAAARDTRSGSRGREARPEPGGSAAARPLHASDCGGSQPCPSRASRSRSVQSASTARSLSSSAGGAISWFRCVPRAKLNHTSSGCRYASCIGLLQAGRSIRQAGLLRAGELDGGHRLLDRLSRGTTDCSPELCADEDRADMAPHCPR
jgi:hypothetical protein